MSKTQLDLGVCIPLPPTAERKADEDTASANSELVAFSEGEVIPLSGEPWPDIASLNYNQKFNLNINQQFNVMWGVNIDESGSHTRDAPRFPDGHVVSPFRFRSWQILTAEQFAALNPTAEERQEWDNLHQQDAEREKKYYEQSAKWFEAIGRYVVSFESMTAALARLVRTLLKIAGLVDDKIRDILIADLTADPMLRLARTLFSAMFKLGEQEERIKKAIFDRVMICIESRNDVVHSNWLPGGLLPRTTGNFLSAHGAKFKLQPTAGTAFQQFGYDIHAMQSLIEQCVAARLFLTDLYTRTKRDYPLDRFITIETDKSVKRLLNYTHTRRRVLVEEYPPPSRHPPSKDADLLEGGLQQDVDSIRIHEDELFVLLMRQFRHFIRSQGGDPNSFDPYGNRTPNGDGGP